jgi:hypothetical protein
MPQTKSAFLAGAGALLILCAAWALAADEQTAIVIDTFSSCIKNRLPCNWEKFRDVKGISLQHDSSNYFVRILSVNDVESIGKRVSYSLHDYPEVHWRWRVNDLPPGAREDIKKKNDSAAGIYVAFKGTFPFNHVIKYVWSTTLPVGTIVKSPHNGKVMIFVIEQGPNNLNHWVPEERNVLNDYLRAFGSQPPLVEGIAIQTDSDNTKSSASADFDDIFISKFTE